MVLASLTWPLSWNKWYSILSRLYEARSVASAHNVFDDYYLLVMYSAVLQFSLLFFFVQKVWYLWLPTTYFIKATEELSPCQHCPQDVWQARDGYKGERWQTEILVPKPFWDLQRKERRTTTYNMWAIFVSTSFGSNAIIAMKYVCRVSSHSITLLQVFLKAECLYGTCPLHTAVKPLVILLFTMPLLIWQGQWVFVCVKAQVPVAQ